MGYTHYWTHKRSFTLAEWGKITAALRAIVMLSNDEGNRIRGADGTGYANLGGAFIAFNGNAEKGLDHETFLVNRERPALESWQRPNRRGWYFCKTARKPYDAAVVASLCYLESIYPAKWATTSDGSAEEWQDGLALAKRALPHLADRLALPREIEFEAQFSEWLGYGGDKYSAAKRHDGTICIFERGRQKIVAEFPAGTDAESSMREAAEQIPRSGLCKVLDQKRDDMLRRFTRNASLYGGTRAT